MREKAQVLTSFFGQIMADNDCSSKYTKIAPVNECFDVTTIHSPVLKIQSLSILA